MRRLIRLGTVAAVALVLGVVALPRPAQASLTNTFIAQVAAGSADGSSCANARAAAFFNTAGNWGAGAAQIGQNTVVHVCGNWTGGNATNFLRFQGSGAAGNVITLLFESGAAMQPNYCSAAGCIDLNNQAFLLIDGGTTCGETRHWATTPCNGLIQNMTVGSPGATCPTGSACTTQLPNSISSSAVGTNGSGSPNNIEIRNFKVHMYSRLPNDLSDGGMGTSAVGWGNGTLSHHIVMHHMMIDGVGMAYILSLGSAPITITDYEVYNSNFHSQCWAMGVGANAPQMNITHLLFHDNEVSNWDAWAPANQTGSSCHTNGTMWFNGDGSTIHTGTTGFIADSTSGQYDNYIHGDLMGGTSLGGASGMLSCQDNCINLPVFNNIIVSTCSGNYPCGGMVYFNGAGGGGQLVYNNTIITPTNGASCVVVTGNTAPVQIENNIAKGCSEFIEIRPNCPTCAVSNFNDGFNVQSGSWVGYNTAGVASFLTLAQWRSTYSQDLSSVTGDPLLNANFNLQAGSPAIRLGTNLTSAGIPALDSDLAGVARPATGPWDAAAYQFGPSPNPPTNLRVSVVR